MLKADDYDRPSSDGERSSAANTTHGFGMKGARFVVAVHPDPDAPIPRQADPAIVGDPANFAGELARLLSDN